MELEEIKSHLSLHYIKDKMGDFTFNKTIGFINQQAKEIERLEANKDYYRKRALDNKRENTNLKEQLKQDNERVKELEEAFTNFENAYLSRRELTDNECVIIDKLRIEINN